MTESECAIFIDGYSSASYPRIAFHWNERHGKDFSDSNQALRAFIVKAVLDAPGRASVELIHDLFEAEARFSKEAWCISPNFPRLGSLLLSRGGVEFLDAFVANMGISFDAYVSAHTMELDPVTIFSMLKELERRISNAADDSEKKRLVVAKQLFDMYKAGNAAAGTVLVPGDQVAKLRIRPPSWLEKLRRFLKA
ncbi:MAG TPA: hypothetical protein VN915_09855 [Elusimicrobiota bacterium]|nr:hypothetical protein [Elusimicrobiota bacterium]